MTWPGFDPYPFLGIPVIGSRAMPDDGCWYVLDVGLSSGPVLLGQEGDPPPTPGEVVCGYLPHGAGRCRACGASR